MHSPRELSENNRLGNSQDLQLLELCHGRRELSEQIVREHERLQKQREAGRQFVHRRVQVQVRERERRYVRVVLEQEVGIDLDIRHVASRERLAWALSALDDTVRSHNGD